MRNAAAVRLCDLSNAAGVRFPGQCHPCMSKSVVLKSQRCPEESTPGKPRNFVKMREIAKPKEVVRTLTLPEPQTTCKPVGNPVTELSGLDTADSLLKVTEPSPVLILYS